MRESSSYPVIVVLDGMVTTRDTATALESGDHFVPVTCSIRGIVARSVQRSGSAGRAAWTP